VEELFEARIPKTPGILAELSGKVSIADNEQGRVITVRTVSEPVEERSYTLSQSAHLLVEDGQLVNMGAQLTAGSLDVRELLQIRGLLAAQQYVVHQIQNVYESQGITIHDKHFEVVTRKMGDKVQIESAGDTEFLTGEVIERSRFISANDAVMAAGGEPATAKVLILGITRSSLFTSSWLSAASFQHTKNVLTDAAASGSIDYLEGLKENVIIGRLIPTDSVRASLEPIMEEVVAEAVTEGNTEVAA
jgi:DNA-directed RNA polymerase subunit beta'